MLFYMPDTMLDPENEMSEEGDSLCPHGVLLRENSVSQVAITTDCVDGYDAGQSTGGPGDTPQGLLAPLRKFRKSIPGETDACTESQNVSNSYISRNGGVGGGGHIRSRRNRICSGAPGSKLHHINSDPYFRRAVFLA